MIDKKIKLLKLVSMLIDKKAVKTDPERLSVTGEFTAYMFNEWSKRAKPLVNQAKNVSITSVGINSFIKKIDSTMGKFGSEIEQEVRDHVKYFYAYYKKNFIEERKLGKKIAKVEAPKIPAEFWFEADTKNVELIEGQIVKSTGEFYGNSCKTAIADSIKKNAFERGLTGTQLRDALVNDLEKALRLKGGALESRVVPEGFKGTAEQYFKGIAEHTATTTRTGSHLTALQDAEVDRFIVRSLKTSRTCLGCIAMDGKTFTVKRGVSHFNKLLEADREELKELQPSFHYKSPSDYSNAEALAQAKADASKMSKSDNVQLPPFHFRCECYVDMA